MLILFHIFFLFHFIYYYDSSQLNYIYVYFCLRLPNSFVEQNRRKTFSQFYLSVFELNIIINIWLQWSYMCVDISMNYRVVLQQNSRKFVWEAPKAWRYRVSTLGEYVGGEKLMGIGHTEDPSWGDRWVATGHLQVSSWNWPPSLPRRVELHGPTPITSPLTFLLNILTPYLHPLGSSHIQFFPVFCWSSSQS